MNGVLRRPLLTFFALTYASTWLAWAAAAAILRTTGSSVLAAPVFLAGTFAPGLSALALTYRAEGPLAVRALLGRILQWQVRARWYIFAIAYIPVVKLTVALVHRVATGAWPRFGDVAWYVMAAALLASTWVQAGEEVGWRGYVLPRLSQRFGLAAASVILGVIWATWHLPLFFIATSSTLGQSFPLYVLQVTAISVAIAWLYWRTDGSLLLVMLFHAAINNTKDIVPSAVTGATNVFALSTSLVAWLTVTLLWIAAAFFLLRMGKVTTVHPQLAADRVGAVHAVHAH